MSDFRERLQQAAKWAGVHESQATMAASLGLNRQTINRWLQGGEPNSEMLAHIAKSWGVDQEWLRIGEGEMLTKPSPDGLSVKERELIKGYRKATPQIRDVIETIVRAVRKSMIAIALGIPPLLASQPSDAAICHNLLRAHLASIICIVARRFRAWLSVLSGGPVFA